MGSLSGLWLRMGLALWEAEDTQNRPRAHREAIDWRTKGWVNKDESMPLCWFGRMFGTMGSL